MADQCPVAAGGGDGADENKPATAGESYLQALKDVKLCDVVFTFENCDDRIEAHQLFLRLRSPVFFDTFGENFGKMREVQMSGVSPQRFQEFLEFMYADKLDVNNADFLDLLRLGHRYEVKPLIEKCEQLLKTAEKGKISPQRLQKFWDFIHTDTLDVNFAGALDLLYLGEKYKVDPLVEKCKELLQTEIKVEDAVQVFETAGKYPEHAPLQAKAGDIMAKSIGRISERGELLNVQENTLVYLLQQNDLTIEEVDLFRLAIKWGENMLINVPQPEDLKTVLANLLPLIRFTAMAPNEFATEVVPLNLLPTKETVTVFTYLASDQGRREALSRSFKFNTSHRNGGEAGILLQGRTPLKECLCFSPNYDMAGGGKMWLGDGSPRRPSITGILLRLPKREIRSYATYNKNLQFKLTIMWSAVAINDQSVGLKRRATFRSDSEQEIEYPIDPPVELCSGAIYGIAVEDQPTCYGSDDKEAQYEYSQRTGGSGVINQSLGVSLKTVPLKLDDIHRNIGLTGFSTEVYSKICLIQGIRIGLV